MEQKKPAPVLDWHGIKAELHRRGMTLTALATRAGLDPSMCRKVNSHCNYKAQKAIADFLDLKPEQLWPDRYPKNKPRILDTAKYPPVEREKDAAGADKRRCA
ncbi:MULTISPECIES: helix-turn-helix domain-containing protein [Rhodovulum]|uniref:Transcriptional regulator n=2 Tax=Rhodovulum TaxID=34008 RepID=A0A844B8H7_9RHOB|nr:MULTISPECIES: helix-turn-helix domain-containing protein [Rhodovulum]MRH22686.1 transcriptional regulator [Rhodovulum strictum]TCM84819.1 Nlp family transcriptional regulator [Rhodovulum steppense]